MHRRQRQRVSRNRVAQRIVSIFGGHLRAMLGAHSSLVQENVHLESRERVRVESKRPVINRVQRVIDEPLWSFNIGSLAVGLDDDKLRDAGTDLHESVRDPLQAVLSKGVHGLLHRSKLIGCILVKDRYSLVKILGAGDEGIDLARFNSGIEISLLSR